jgi:hypothetical protein
MMMISLSRGELSTADAQALDIQERSERDAEISLLMALKIKEEDEDDSLMLLM